MNAQMMEEDFEQGQIMSEHGEESNDGSEMVILTSHICVWYIALY
jgi:hypothetical protein